MKLYDSLFANAPGVMAAIEQHPVGAAVLFGVVVFALACPVLVAWFKYRRR